MEIDPRVKRLYEVYREDDRLWEPGRGDLTRLRTWDLFERFLPAGGRVLDVGGGPGTHASHLAEAGHSVTLIDPMPEHVERASVRAVRDGHDFDARLGNAADLDVADDSVDAVLLMGPLYHLVDRTERYAALAEAGRVLRPGGRLMAEVITRNVWTIDGTLMHLLDRPGELNKMERIASTGISQDPGAAEPGTFWAYFHRPEELREELGAAGFVDIELVAVEGFAWLLGDLEGRMAHPDLLLQAVRLTESDPSMLGVSAHVMGIATAP